MDRKKSPILYFIVGVALLIVGLANDNTAIWIVGIVFMILGMTAWRKRSRENTDGN